MLQLQFHQKLDHFVLTEPPAFFVAVVFFCRATSGTECAQCAEKGGNSYTMAKGNTIFQLVTCLTHSFPKHYQIQLWGYTNPYLVHMRVSYCKHKNTYHSCVHELPHTVPSPARTSVHMNYDCGLSYSQVGSNVAKLGHTGACTPATRDCAPPL